MQMRDSTKRQLTKGSLTGWLQTSTLPLVILLALSRLEEPARLIAKPGEQSRLLHRPEPLLSYENFRNVYQQQGKLLPNRPAVEIKIESSLIEHLARHASFLGHTMRVASLNCAYLAGASSYLASQNPLVADLTPDEVRQINQGTLSPGAVRGGPELQTKKPFEWLGRHLKPSSYEIPNLPLEGQSDPSKITHIYADHRACLGPIKNQRTCGACYAFGWIGFIEAHYCLQSGKQINFSEQHLVDCGHEVRLNGCNEGTIPKCRAFTHINGLHLESEYPYEAKVKSCKRRQGEHKVQVSHFEAIKVDRSQWEAILLEQPIVVEVNLPNDILLYSKGVHPGHNCQFDLGHAMLLVGYGSEQGKPYWILRNSAGPKWGENGYLRLSRDLANMEECLWGGYLARFKFANLDEDLYERFYGSLKAQGEPDLNKSQRTRERVGQPNQNLLDFLAS